MQKILLSFIVLIISNIICLEGTDLLLNREYHKTDEEGDTQILESSSVDLGLDSIERADQIKQNTIWNGARL